MLEPSAIGGSLGRHKNAIVRGDRRQRKHRNHHPGRSLESIEGRPWQLSQFQLTKRARFVDGCLHPLQELPSRVSRRWTCPTRQDAGLTYRKAIYTPMSDTLPQEWVIDIDNCLNTPPNYLPCNRCIEVCDDNAIFFNLPLETIHERQVGAVILAPGFRTEGPGSFRESWLRSAPRYRHFSRVAALVGITRPDRRLCFQTIRRRISRKHPDGAR